MVILKEGMKLELIKDIPNTNEKAGVVATITAIDSKNNTISARLGAHLMVMSFEECEEYFKVYENKFAINDNGIIYSNDGAVKNIIINDKSKRKNNYSSYKNKNKNKNKIFNKKDTNKNNDNKSNNINNEKNDFFVTGYIIEVDEYTLLCQYVFKEENNEITLIYYDECGNDFPVTAKCKNPKKFNLNKGLKIAEQKMINKLIKENVIPDDVKYTKNKTNKENDKNIEKDVENI